MNKRIFCWVGVSRLLLGRPEPFFQEPVINKTNNPQNCPPKQFFYTKLFFYFTPMHLKKSLISICCICLSFSAWAQDSAKSTTATVYFMRTSGMMGLTAFSAFIDDSLACHVHNNRFSVHTLAPGLHKFSARADGKKQKKNIQTVDINLKAGEKYYLVIDVVDRYFAGSISLIEVTYNTAKKMFVTLKEETDCGL